MTTAVSDARLDGLHVLLRAAHRLPFSNERELQDGIERILCAASERFQREHEIAPGFRIDFFVEPGIGVEVKVAGSNSEVLRQVAEYAACPAVQAVILVTTRFQHWLPRDFSGKPLRLVHLPIAFR